MKAADALGADALRCHTAETLSQRFDQFFCNPSSVVRSAYVDQHDDKLIATQPGNGVGFSDAVAEPLSDLFGEDIASLMP
ncbi:MAG: hypothetical protein R3F37_16860 [Candidatus Competibacteraceae bacterium]